MGDAVGRLYVESHFPPEIKGPDGRAGGQLARGLPGGISELEWMTPTTREQTLAKLDKFTPKIGYPTSWRDYSTLDVSRDDLYGNVIRGASWTPTGKWPNSGIP